MKKPRRFRVWRHKGQVVYATSDERCFHPGKASRKRIQRLTEQCEQEVYFTNRRSPVFWYTFTGRKGG